MDELLDQLTINAFEEREIDIFDISGAYLNYKITEDKFVLLKLEDEFVETMSEVNLEFRKDVFQEYKKKILYLRLLRALYGCIESTLLWYNMHNDTLKIKFLN